MAKLDQKSETVTEKSEDLTIEIKDIIGTYSLEVWISEQHVGMFKPFESFSEKSGVIVTEAANAAGFQNIIAKLQEQAKKALPFVGGVLHCPNGNTIACVPNEKDKQLQEAVERLESCKPVEDEYKWPVEAKDAIPGRRYESKTGNGIYTCFTLPGSAELWFLSNKKTNAHKLNPDVPLLSATNLTCTVGSLEQWDWFVTNSFTGRRLCTETGKHNQITVWSETDNQIRYMNPDTPCEQIKKDFRSDN